MTIQECLKPANIASCSRPYIRIANGAFAGSFFGMIYGIVFGTLYSVVGSIIFSMSFSGLSSFTDFWLQNQRIVVLAMMLGALLCAILGGINSMRKSS